MGIFLFWIIFSILAGVIANSKGRSGFGFFLLSVFLSPLIGIVCALIAQKHEPQKQLYRCPDCKETIMKDAIVCKHCGLRFDSERDTQSAAPSDAQQMEKYRITYDGMHYKFGEYKYTKLSDAINYANAMQQQEKSIL